MFALETWINLILAQGDSEKKMSLGRIKRIISAPGRKLHEVRMNTFYMGASMLNMVRRPILKKYELLDAQTKRAIVEIRAGPVSVDTFKFFSNYVSNRTALKFGKSEEDKLFRERLLVIALAISNKTVCAADADWLENTLLPFLEKCKQADLKVVSQEILQRRMRVKEGDIFGENNIVPEGIPKDNEDIPASQ